MRRRKLLSASIGLGALAGLAKLTDQSDREVLAGLAMHTESDLAFGTTVTIKVLHNDGRLARVAIQDALQRVREVDSLMSLKQVNSQVFQLNQRGVVEGPNAHLLHVLAFAQQLSLLTSGAFDITVQSLWRVFSLASAKGELPAPTDIAAAKDLVNWRSLEYGPQQARLLTPGMAITLNGVAQGYAVDLALQALRNHGVRHALLDTGEYGSIGNKSLDQPWLLGVGHPRRLDGLAATLKMDGRKVATSGDYATFFSPDFVHHHIFDPVSGDSPLELASATVVAPTGILADGLSTAFMVMGADKALALAAQMHDVDALLINKNGSTRKTAHFPELHT